MIGFKSQYSRNACQPQDHPSPQKSRLSRIAGQTAGKSVYYGHRNPNGKEAGETVKIELRLDEAEREPRVVIHAAARTAEVEELLSRLEEVPGGPLWGFREGGAVPLEPADVLRFYGEDKAIAAQTSDGVYTVRRRLYELEELLPSHQFVRVSHSEIINLKRITALDLGLTGTIRITLDGGVVTYASRRYVKKIKEALGL